MNEKISGIFIMKKRCSKCGKSKDKSEFYKDQTSKDGLTYKCKACVRLEYRLYYRENRKRESQRKFISRHGVGLIYKNFLLASQGWACAICGKTLKPNSSDACLDHNHETENIRGVLCRACNVRVGLYGDGLGKVAKGIQAKGFQTNRIKTYNYLLAKDF